MRASLLVACRIRGLLPRLGPLKRDVLLGEDLTQPLPTRLHLRAPLRTQIVGQLADRPTSERPTQRPGPGHGRLDDQLAISSRENPPDDVVVIWRGRPPAHRGSNDRIPNSLNRWIISRTRSGLVATNRAITATSLPPADASTTIARRHFTIDFSVRPPPRRTIRWNCRPSSSRNRRTRTRSAIPTPCATRNPKWWTRPPHVRGQGTSRGQQWSAVARTGRSRHHYRPRRCPAP